VIPLGHRRQVFDAFHGMAHPGARATKRIMGQRVTWSCMNKDVTQWVKDCQTCSRAKVIRQPAAALQPIPVPRQRFSHIHVDIVGPLPVSREGFRYLFTIIDRSSRLLEAVPLANVETDTCRDALISQWVARFGVPAHLTSDQGAQFTSALWARLCDVIGTHHNTTTAYHPQSNSLVERDHRRLKDAFKARMAAADWPQHLSWVLLDIKNAPKEDTGKSTAQMVYGTSLTLPAQLAFGEELPVDKILRDLSNAAPIPIRHGQREAPTEPPTALATAELVYVRKGGQLQPLAQPYSGLYKVLEKGPKYFRLDISGKSKAVTLDRLKPHTGNAETTLAAPPRRSRPPRQRPASPATPAMTTVPTTSTSPATPAMSTAPTTPARAPSPGLPAATGARPARPRRAPNRLDL